MQIQRLIDPTPEEIAQILELFRQIEYRECTVKDYLDYLDTYWATIAVFVVVTDGKITGFLHCDSPSVLSPKTAWITYAYNTPSNGHSAAVECLSEAERWMQEVGATRWRMLSERPSTAFKRAWGCALGTMKLMEKDIDDGQQTEVPATTDE